MSNLVTFGLGATSPYVLMGFDSAAIVPPNQPGLEYTLPSDRLHYTLENSKMHYTLDISRLHYTLSDEDN